MAYVPGFDHDVFLSYAHDDDPAWISAFERALNQSLRERFPGVRLWQDARKLRVGQNWQAEIEQAILSSAAFLAVLSPAYRASDWCGRERRCFRAQFTSLADMKVADFYRFFKIVKTPWPGNAHREFFAELQHIEFFGREGGGDQEIELTPGEFDRKIRETTGAIGTLLTQMRHRCECIFLASPADDLRGQCAQLDAELRANGYDVRPEGFIDEAFSDTLIRRDLDSAILVVFLLGARYDPFVLHQLDLALAAGKRLLFWIAGELRAQAAPLQKELIEAISDFKTPSGVDLPDSTTVLESPTPGVMIREVLDILKPKPALAAGAPGVSAVPRVYLIHDPTAQEDSLFAAQLRRQITEREGMEVVAPEAGLSSPVAFRELHQRLLLGCDGVLLYREKAPEQWLYHTVPDVLFAEQQLRRPPIRSKALLLSDSAAFEGLPNVRVISRSPEFDLRDLEPFLAPLRAGQRSTHAGG